MALTVRVSIFLIIFSLLVSCAGDLTNNKTDILFEVKKGESFQVVVKRLKKENIIKNTLRFQLLAKVLHKDHSLKYGVYQINPHESYVDLIHKFASGQTYSIHIVIPEGFNLYQIAELLEKKGFGKKEDFIRLCQDKTFAHSLGISGASSLEGYLYPDTYFVPEHYEPKMILRLLVEHFFDKIDSNIVQTIQSKGLNLNKIITMASIVVREAKQDFEKPIIAGVYYNRIKKGMKLQADPTLIYALTIAGTYDGDIKFRDFSFDSKYNTYKYYGLPPSPIANPDKSSILAAVYPADVDYLYFVAKNDGTHYFSKTLAEHNKAVYQYQRLPAIERRQKPQR